MDHLTLQVGNSHRIEIHNLEGAHPGCGQILQHRPAQSAGSDNRYSGGLYFFLPLDADLPEQKMPAELIYLSIVQRYLFSPNFGNYPLLRSAAGNKGKEEERAS